MTAVNSLGDTEGGLCRVGGTISSSSYYMEAGDTPCSEAEMITTEAECETAFDYLVLNNSYEGTFDGTASRNNRIPGCRWATGNGTNIKFNADMAAVNSNGDS